MKERLLIPVTLLALPVVALAQTPSQAPQPGPEQKRLEYFAGAWTTEMEMKAGPMGSGGKMTTTDKSQMMPGGFFLVTHTEGSGTMGEVKELAVMGYDAESKKYTYDSYNNFGEAQHFKGTVDGDTWTWFGDLKPGSPVKLRFIAKEVSAKQYTMRLEMLATPGGNWLPVMSGRATRAK